MVCRMVKGVLARELGNVPCIRDVYECTEYEVLCALEDASVRRSIMQVLSGKNKILNIKEDILEDRETIVLLVRLININKANSRNTTLY